VPLKNLLLALKNGLRSQAMRGQSRKHPEKLNLNHEHQVKWEIPAECRTTGKPGRSIFAWQPIPATTRGLALSGLGADVGVPQ
jgi:hypothetical protein